MTTFHSVILKCPQCGGLMSSYELMSYTVHNEPESWSDGQTGFGIPRVDRIGICAICREPFWKEDYTLPDDPDWSPEVNLASVMDLMDLEWFFDDDRDLKTISFFYDLLETYLADTEEKELYIRNRLMWAINDLIRHNAKWWKARSYRMLKAVIENRRQSLKKFEDLELMMRDNLERMIFLYIKSEDVDLIFLAEMYREHENFEKAADILGKVEQRGSTWKKIRKKVRRKDSMVFQLS